MMRIRVVGRQGVALDGSQMVEFGPAGGSVGRADSNTLVLSDPERTVSRVHAQVLFRHGQYFVVDRGSNPMQCNGAPVGNGQELALHGGERLLLGTFELLVEMTERVDAPDGAAMWPDAPSASAAQGVLEDDPFADLLVGLPGVPVVAAAPPAAPSAPKGVLPDPFGDAEPLVRPDTLPDLAAGDDFSDLGMGRCGTGSSPAVRMDELFGGPVSGAGAGGDPLANSPLGEGLQPNTHASADDPFASFGQVRAVTADPVPDHVPVGQFGFQPPVIVRDGAPAVAPARSPSPASMPPVPPVAPPRPTATPAMAQEADALLAAFLRGIGPLHQTPAQMTPELMERIGLLLRCSAEGTLQLLLARQELKREVRAELTMIGAHANNPLKYSPSADVALAHLLGPTMRGFMPAEAAMEDAYNDLRAHQFGVMVGVRAALAQLIERFGPEQLERKIAARTALDSVFAAQRKARLWDQFTALYASIAQEAEDDFHALFGAAFARAYDEQMARLKRAGADR